MPNVICNANQVFATSKLARVPSATRATSQILQDAAKKHKNVTLNVIIRVLPAIQSLGRAALAWVNFVLPPLVFAKKNILVTPDAPQLWDLAMI